LVSINKKLLDGSAVERIPLHQQGSSWRSFSEPLTPSSPGVFLTAADRYAAQTQLLDVRSE
jgi:hypothetical protein